MSLSKSKWVAQPLFTAGKEKNMFMEQGFQLIDHLINRNFIYFPLITNLQQRCSSATYSMQRAMAAEAEAAREASEPRSSRPKESTSRLRALANAAEIISQTPAALQVGSVSFLSMFLTPDLDTQLRSILGPNKEKSIFLKITLSHNVLREKIVMVVS